MNNYGKEESVLQYLGGDDGAGFCVGEGVMVVGKDVSAVSGDGVELVVWKMWKCSARGLSGTEERAVGVGHVIVR